MPPKKGKVEEEPPDDAEGQEEEEQEPAEPEIVKKCFRVGSQLYFGDCKLGYRDRKGTFVRQGLGSQVNAAVIPAGPWVANRSSYETLVLGFYDGNWDGDCITGQGKYKWSDGSSYEGGFIGGQMHGIGRFAWPDGSSYEGGWHKGTMHGQGRLDSRFDGRFVQGKFHRNCLAKQDGRWVDILEQMRSEEQHCMLEGDSSSLPIRRCAWGEGEASEQQRKSLLAAITAIQNEGLVPFIVAEESLAGFCSALECLQSAKLLDCSRHCVSIRLASIAKRRKRDFRRFFYNAIQSSLRDGAVFALVFEDDVEGCSAAMGHNAEEDAWFQRRPKVGSVANTLPEDWRLADYFEPSVLPPEVFTPTLFNGRVLSRRFLPEATLSAGPRLPGDPAAPGVGGEASPEPKTGEDDRVFADAMAACQATAAAAAAPTPAGGLGLTGHVFECTSGPPQNFGLKQAYYLRPVVVSQAYITPELSKEAVRKFVVDRLHRHAPMHRTGIVVLGSRGDDDMDS